MGTYATTQLASKRFRILPLPSSSKYELWDTVTHKPVTVKPFPDYYSALMARIAVEHGHDRIA